MILFSVFLEFSNNKTNSTNGDNLYFVDTNKLLEISNADLSLDEKISKLSNLSQSYPADIDVFKALQKTKRDKYFESHEGLSIKIASLNKKMNLYKGNDDKEKFTKTHQALLSILPRQKEFEPLRENYSPIIETEKKTSKYQKKTALTPIGKLEKLLDDKSFIEAVNLGISLFYQYCENKDFEKLYKELLLEFNTKDVYINGFIQRAEKEGVKEKPPSTISFMMHNAKTLKFSNFLFFSDIVIAKDVLLTDKATSSTEKYDFGIMQGDMIFLKPHINEASLILYSSEIEFFLENYSLILSSSPTNFMKYDVVNLLKSMSFIKKFNPHNYPYLHSLYSFYINAFFMNLIIVLVFLYFSFNVTRKKLNPIFFLFGVFFSTLLHCLRSYFSFILFYFSMGDYLYFYLFDNLINLLMLFLAISLYSSTNPKIKSENAYAFYENTLKR